VVGWLKGLSLPPRLLLLVVGFLLVFFAAFGVGASVGVFRQGGLPSSLAARVQGPDEGTARSDTTGAPNDRASENTTTGTTEETESAEPAEPATQATFLHRATDANSRGDYTYLDAESINGDANAIVLASPASDGAYGHNVGVWYDFADRRRWAVFNQDRAPVPAGSTFKVVVPAESEAFVHRASSENTSTNVTYIDDPLTNNKPEIEVSVAQNWNPGGGIGVYNDHPVGVRYEANRGRWAIFNEDLAPIRGGAAFNVRVSGR
jgi:hypothetical protein